MHQELEEDNLNQLIQSNKKVIVQYSAGWCGNCRIMKPKFKRHASEHTNVLFLVVDAEKFPESRKLAQVNNLPTFAFFQDGKCISQVQTNKSDSLQQFIHETASN